MLNNYLSAQGGKKDGAIFFNRYFYTFPCLILGYNHIIHPKYKKTLGTMMILHD